MGRLGTLLVLAALGLPASAVPTAGQEVGQRLGVCLACHGAKGTSQLEGVPSLGAMPSDYVLTQLYMFREKRRVSAPMTALAADLTDDDLRALGDAITVLPPPEVGEALPAAEQAQGQALVDRYHCNSCHGAKLAGQDNIPRIAGQREEYLRAALTGYKNGSRPGYSPAMSEASQEMKLEDIPVLARFVARFR